MGDIGKTDCQICKFFKYRKDFACSMDLKELNYIVAIADEGSISRAADKLYMAQSSLSQFLFQYEAELGAKLFVRTARGVRPTSAGEVFIDHARQILMDYHRTKNEIWDIEQLHGGRIDLGISTFRGTRLLPRVLKEFRRTYPGIHVKITEQDSAALENLIIDGTLDIAMIALPAIRLKSNFDYLMTDEVMIVAAKDHPVMEYVHRNIEADGSTSQPWVSLADAARFEFIFGAPKTMLGRIARREFRKRNLSAISWNTSFSAGFAAAMGREGVALSFTYRTCIVPDENVEYLRIDPEGVFMDLALAYPSNAYRSKATKALASLMTKMFRREGNL